MARLQMTRGMNRILFSCQGNTPLTPQQYAAVRGKRHVVSAGKSSVAYCKPDVPRKLIRTALHLDKSDTATSVEKHPSIHGDGDGDQKIVLHRHVKNQHRHGKSRQKAS
ncbi:uncharacterized protein MEPE_00479 [Melanopsichium pennsylvanicum]|uniref:Uncharacterized protein n=1 Tax=Melanopsichium pennsylvanicum TaxID=63383 RepID=A0AAJ4XFY8_9BASI|nr:uncharacterized protein MEPE_00479 [Melanopsichium pennsylvanicum]